MTEQVSRQLTQNHPKALVRITSSGRFDLSCRHSDSDEARLDFRAEALPVTSHRARVKVVLIIARMAVASDRTRSHC